MCGVMEDHSLLHEIEDKHVIFDGEGKFSKMKSIANVSIQLKEYKSRKNKKLP